MENYANKGAEEIIKEEILTSSTITYFENERFKVFIGFSSFFKVHKFLFREKLNSRYGKDLKSEIFNWFIKTKRRNLDLYEFDSNVNFKDCWSVLFSQALERESCIIFDKSDFKFIEKVTIEHYRVNINDNITARGKRYKIENELVHILTHDLYG